MATTGKSKHSILEAQSNVNLTIARSRVYFDIEIGNRKEGRVVFELVSIYFYILFLQFVHSSHTVILSLLITTSTMMVSASKISAWLRKQWTYAHDAQKLYRKLPTTFVLYALGKRARESRASFYHIKVISARSSDLLMSLFISSQGLCFTESLSRL